METNDILKVGDICVLTHNRDIIFDFESTNEFGFPTSKRVYPPTLSNDIVHTTYAFDVFDKPQAVAYTQKFELADEYEKVTF